MNKKLLLVGLFTTMLMSGCGTPISASSNVSSTEPSTSDVSSDSNTSEELPSSISSLIESSWSMSSDTTSSEDSSITPSSSIAPSSSSAAPSSSSSSIAPSSSSTSKSSSSSTSKTTSSTSITPDTMWNVDLTARGESFRNSLQKAMASKKKGSCAYKSCLAEGAKAAAYPNPSSSTFVPFYHDTKTLTTTGSCNREHTWPNSRGTGENGFNDPFIIRPTLTSDNSSRGNKFYGATNSEWDPGSLGFEGARGESARVIFYTATMYASQGLSLSNNPGDGTSKKTMGTLKYLIEWNNKYPVTDIERQINEYYYKQGYGRNPFVDHPEYANLIWDTKGLLNDQGGSGTGGGGDDEPVYNYKLFNNTQSLDGKSLVIAHSEIVDGIYYGLSGSAKSDSLPWYLIPITLDVNDDKSQMYCNDIALIKYTFRKQSDGTYMITTPDGRYLYSYIDASHYSIGLAANPTKGSSRWNITTNGNGYTFKGDGTNVHLEYYNTSFCGYQYTPKVPIMLYESI